MKKIMKSTFLILGLLFFVTPKYVKGDIEKTTPETKADFLKQFLKGRLNFIKDYPGKKFHLFKEHPALMAICYGVFITESTILLKNLRKNKIQNQAEFIVQNYERIKDLIDKNKSIELTQELQKGSFRWISRIKTLYFPAFSLLEIITGNLLITKLAKEESPLEQSLFWFIKEAALWGGSRWLFGSMLDTRQTQLTADYLIKNKTELDSILSKKDSEELVEIELKGLLDKSYQSIFTELGSFVLLGELYDFTRRFAGI